MADYIPTQSVSEEFLTIAYKPFFNFIGINNMLFNISDNSPFPTALIGNFSNNTFLSGVSKNIANHWV